MKQTTSNKYKTIRTNALKNLPKNYYTYLDFYKFTLTQKDNDIQKLEWQP